MIDVLDAVTRIMPVILIAAAWGDLRRRVLELDRRVGRLEDLLIEGRR